MATGRLVAKSKKTSKTKYWYYQRSYRVKIDPKDRALGDTGPGSGKSRVVTEEIYLGSADEVLRKCRELDRPMEVQSKAFGLECAALAVARELDLINIIDRHVAKRRQGLSVGEYLVVGAINRICKPTSRSGLAGWFDKTVLPEKMQIDPMLLKSKNFWDAFDKMICESEVKRRRKAVERGQLAEDETVLDDQVILDIESDIWEHLLTLHGIQLNPLLYDTTNFFSFLEPTTESDLYRYARSKDMKQGHRCVGLAIGITQPDGFPLFHLVYPANRHDSKLFPDAIHKLTDRLAEMSRTVEGMVLVVDKGNNSQSNIQQAVNDHRMTIIGSLVPSHHMDLMRKQLRSYKEECNGLPAYREEREVFGIPSVVVVTYNEKSKRRQERRLKEKLDQLEQQVRQTFHKHSRKDSKVELEQRIRTVLQDSDVKAYLTVEIGGRRFKTLHMQRDPAKLRDKMATLGKTIHFSTKPSMAATEVVDRYRSRNDVENTFKLEKDPHGIPFRPTNCWTDSKIRVYAFVCVLALLIWRTMQYKLRRSDLRMSDRVLKMELNDLREVASVYGSGETKQEITKRSKVQDEIVSILGLLPYFPREQRPALTR
jgi:transposase